MQYFSHDTTQRRGALFCRSGTWLEIVDRRTAEFDARRNHMSQPDYVRGTRKETSRFSKYLIKKIFQKIQIFKIITFNNFKITITMIFYSNT